ncbi:MAG: DUF3618 domain-containing protein [Sphingomicrobium sp.]
MDDFRIVEAEAEVDRARGQLLDTVGEFADRLEPRKILNEMWDSAKEKSAGIAGDAVDAVKSRPVAATGIVAALTMFFAREPIKQGIVNIYDAMTSGSDEEPEAVETKSAKPPTPRKPRSRRTAITEKTK